MGDYRKEFANLNFDDILMIWEVCLGCGIFYLKKKWLLESSGVGILKFYVDRAEQGKPRQPGIGGVLQNDKEDVLTFFFKHIGVRYSNRAEVLAILEALRIHFGSL